RLSQSQEILDEFDPVARSDRFAHCRHTDPGRAAFAELHRRHLPDPDRAPRIVRRRKFPFVEMTARTRLDMRGTARARGRSAWRAVLWVGLLSLLAGCASLPPGSDYPKATSIALIRPEQTRMGQQLAAAKTEHPGLSGFKLLPVGIDSFLLRMEMAEAAGRTLDVQYFLIQSDDTGQLLIEALLKAADRGVRVRVLLDDAGSFGRDAQIRTLAGYANVELRLFNPFAYRGNIEFLHFAEYLADVSR